MHSIETILENVLKLVSESIFIRKGNVFINIPVVFLSFLFERFNTGVPITMSFFEVILFMYMANAAKNNGYAVVLFSLQNSRNLFVNLAGVNMVLRFDSVRFSLVVRVFKTVASGSGSNLLSQYC